MTSDHFYADNRANWNDRAQVHATSEMYRLDQYRDVPTLVSGTVAYDADRFGSIVGQRVAHLQCHIGTDTISLKRIGASSVVGVDFSDQAVGVATELAADAAPEGVRFVEASVYDAIAAVGHTVDFVYTSVGTICWLHDLDRWAAAVAGLLEPGGRFYMRDTHPTLFVFEEVDGNIVPHYNYWYEHDAPLTWNEDFTYSDDPDGIGIQHTRNHEWNHSLSDVVTALASNGMHVTRMEEHQGIEWEFTPSCTREGEQWFLPEPLRSQIPAMFSLHATKL